MDKSYSMCNTIGKVSSQDMSNMDKLLEDMSLVDMDTLWDISIELDMLFEDWLD